jgi:hypothetical protein
MVAKGTATGRGGLYLQQPGGLCVVGPLGERGGGSWNCVTSRQHGEGQRGTRAAGFKGEADAVPSQAAAVMPHPDGLPCSPAP